MQVNIEKKHLYVTLSVLVILFSSLYVIAQTFTTPAWDSSKQSHDVLYTNTITSKASTPRVVKVDGDLEVVSGSGITLGGVKQTSWPTGGTGDVDCMVLPSNVPIPVTALGQEAIPVYNSKYKHVNTFSAIPLPNKCVGKCPSPDAVSCTKVQNEIVGSWRAIIQPTTIECEWRCENFGPGGESLAAGCSFLSSRNEYTLIFDYNLICK